MECTGREGSKVHGEQRSHKAVIASYEPQSMTCILDSCVRLTHELHQQGLSLTSRGRSFKPNKQGAAILLLAVSRTTLS